MTDRIHEIRDRRENPDELLPCPFCGGEARVIDLPEEYNKGGVAVECRGCRASSCVGFSVKDDARPRVLYAWNRRSPDITHLLECAEKAEARVKELEQFVAEVTGCEVDEEGVAF